MSAIYENAVDSLRIGFGCHGCSLDSSGPRARTEEDIGIPRTAKTAG